MEDSVIDETEQVGGLSTGALANVKEPDTVSAPSSQVPLPGTPFQSAAAWAETVLPRHEAAIAGIVHTALLIVPPDSVIDGSQMPLMLPPAYCMSHVASALRASIWKKFAALQVPLYVPDIVTVSPASQSADVPPLQPGTEFTDAERRLQAEGRVVVVVVGIVDWKFAVSVIGPFIVMLTEFVVPV